MKSNAKTARPPITPPAIAPAFDDDFLEDVESGMVEELWGKMVLVVLLLGVLLLVVLLLAAAFPSSGVLLLTVRILK